MTTEADHRGGGAAGTGGGSRNGRSGSVKSRVAIASAWLEQQQRWRQILRSFHYEEHGWCIIAVTA